MKTLIIYFSVSGKTRVCAEAVSKEIRADIREVRLKNLRSGVLLYIMGGFEALFGRKIELLQPNYDLTGYDTVILASPTWVGRPAPAMFTYASNANFKDKNVIVFTTSLDKPENVKNTLLPFIERTGGKLIGKTGVKSLKKSDTELAKEAIAVIGELGVEK